MKTLQGPLPPPVRFGADNFITTDFAGNEVQVRNGLPVLSTMQQSFSRTPQTTLGEVTRRDLNSAFSRASGMPSTQFDFDSADVSSHTPPMMRSDALTKHEEGLGESTRLRRFSPNLGDRRPTRNADARRTAERR